MAGPRDASAFAAQKGASERPCRQLRGGCIRGVNCVYVANETVFAGFHEAGVLGMNRMTPTRSLVIPNTKIGAERLPDRSALTGCPWHDVKAMLREVGLRPTRQRMALGWILFGKGDRHLTAEMLYEEATRAKVPVSLATIYNTLHQFTERGARYPGRRSRRRQDPDTAGGL